MKDFRGEVLTSDMTALKERMVEQDQMIRGLKDKLKRKDEEDFELFKQKVQFEQQMMLSGKEFYQSQVENQQ